MGQSLAAAESQLRLAVRDGAPLRAGMERVLRGLPASAGPLLDFDWAGDADRCALSLLEALDAKPIHPEAEELWLRLRLERWHDRVEGCSIDVLAGTESDSYSNPIDRILWQADESLDAPCASRAAQILEEDLREFALVSFAALLCVEFFHRLDERMLPGETGGLGITAGFELGFGVHLGFHDGESLDSKGWTAFREA